MIEYILAPPPVAQLDNAADSDSEERGFESLRAGQKIQVFGLGFFYPLRKQWHIINTALPCCISSVRQDCISSRVSVYQKILSQ